MLAWNLGQIGYKQKYMMPAFQNQKPQIHHPVSRKKKNGKLPAAPKAPVLTKIVPINPFANWIMPPRTAPYIKPKETGDCL